MPRPARSGGSRLSPSTIPIPLVTVSLRLDRRAKFERHQYLLSARLGRRITQWEVLDDLLERVKDLTEENVLASDATELGDASA